MLTRRKVVTLNKAQVIRVGLLVLLGFSIGIYAIFVPSVDNSRVSLALFVAPIVIGLFVLKDAPRVFLALLILSLCFSARLRFGNEVFHPGGAEAAIAPLDFPLFGLVSFWFLETCTIKRRIGLRLTPIDKAFLLFLLAHLPSLILAPDQRLAWLEVGRLAKMAAVMLVVRHYVKTKRALVYVVSLLFLSVIMQGLLAASQSFLGSSFGLGFLGERDTFWVLSRAGFTFGRAGGTLGHANALANFFETLVPLALAVYLSPMRGWLRALSLGALGFGLLGLFLTFSRAGWGAILIGFFVVVLMTVRLGSKQRKRAFIYVVLVLALIGITVFLFRDAILQRLTVYGDASWVVRIGTYQVAWNMVQENLVWGVGANNYLAVSQEYLGDMAPVFARLPVHNVLFLVTAEMGLFGLFAFLLLLFNIGRQVRNLSKAKTGLIPAVATGLWAGTIALLAHAMLDWLFRYDSIHTLFWFITGLVVAAGNILLNKSAHQSTLHKNPQGRTQGVSF